MTKVILPNKVRLWTLCILPVLNLQGAVTISSPSNGATVTSPVPLVATTTGAQPSSIAVYDNSSLILKQNGVSEVNASLNLTTGPHTIVVEVSQSLGKTAGVSATTSITVSGVANSAWWSEIASDMTGLNEGYPHGVPGYAWASGPVIEMGNNANGWKALTGWGVVYEAAEGNPATNTRVNLRNVQTYFLQKRTGKWLLLQNTSTPDGAAYVEDFSNDQSKPADVRNEPDGTISVTAGGGYNYHFYPADRASISPDDIGGILVIFQARLIVGNAALPDDRNIARYLAGAGADYYPALTGGWPGNLPYNPGAAIGKEKYVQSQWRFYSVNTLSATELAANPPPIDLTGVAP